MGFNFKPFHSKFKCIQCFLRISTGVFIMLTLQFWSILCQEDSREYTSDRVYDASYQNLTEVPTDIPAYVVEVNLIGNKITKIKTDVFSHLFLCENLQLGGNPISEIEPGAFNALVSLKLLTLSHSRIERLYKNIFADLVSCKSLSVQGNQISEVEPGTFNKLSGLETLYLNINELMTLKGDMFQGLLALKSLSLYDNKINSIEDNTFINLTELESLDLNDNYLTVLNSGMFSGLVSLLLFRLEGNLLTTLSAEVFSDMPRPLTLGLHDAVYPETPDNPLVCDAELCWLKVAEIREKITWFFYGNHPDSPYKPECANGIDWDTWKCVFPGKFYSINTLYFFPAFEFIKT